MQQLLDQYQLSLSESSRCQHLDTKVTDESLQLCSMGCTRITKVQDHSQFISLVKATSLEESVQGVDVNSNPVYIF